MADGADRIVAGVDQLAAAWVVAAVTRIVDAWARLAPDERAAVLEQARAAGVAARTRVVDELRAFFALDVHDQQTTPLAIVRTLRREATVVLQMAGIPEVERDEFDTRAFPDDVYGIVPLALGELGDEELGGALLAWGMGKAGVLREGKNND